MRLGNEWRAVGEGDALEIALAESGDVPRKAPGVGAIFLRKQCKAMLFEIDDTVPKHERVALGKQGQLTRTGARDSEHFQAAPRFVDDENVVGLCLQFIGRGTRAEDRNFEALPIKISSACVVAVRADDRMRLINGNEFGQRLLLQLNGIDQHKSVLKAIRHGGDVGLAFGTERLPEEKPLGHTLPLISNGGMGSHHKKG